MIVQNLTAFKGQQFDFYVQVDHEPNDINTTEEVVETNYTYTGNLYDKPGGTSAASFTLTPFATYLLATLSEGTISGLTPGDYWYHIVQTPTDGSAAKLLMGGRFFLVQA